MKDKKEPEKKDFDVDKKLKAINDSRMPDWQKEECRNALSQSKPASDQVPLHVYVMVKKIKHHIHEAMKTFPGAKDTKLATMEKWDEIFKKF